MGAGGATVSGVEQAYNLIKIDFSFSQGHFFNHFSDHMVCLDRFNIG